ncbi:MarR family winged helix-turn-helix transcriptional regulator [Lacticaseibacillus baoqingensis]|uniref:MarR family winged helix-turn-helix transcriptional regulator n=1 Tax=Lacticaseibacillus baoqingensis TaxID=2486013 RepID=A0ABW4E6E8_9LACO|nr:MarR family transcriptional regulator [Lacticaseibacillus baoqingensis]
MAEMSAIMLPVMINKLKKRLDSANEVLLKQYGLSKLHLLYLMALLEHNEGMTLKELSDFLGFDKANTSRAISKLIDKKYVQKRSQGELEFKYKVELTSQGHEVASLIQAQNESANQQIVALFTPEELALLAKIGSKLWQYLENEDA